MVLSFQGPPVERWFFPATNWDMFLTGFKRWVAKAPSEALPKHLGGSIYKAFWNHRFILAFVDPDMGLSKKSEIAQAQALAVFEWSCVSLSHFGQTSRTFLKYSHFPLLIWMTLRLTFDQGPLNLSTSEANMNLLTLSGRRLTTQIIRFDEGPAATNH